jgi:flavodoxin I
VNAIVIYESLTGNTRRAAARIGADLDASGVSTSVCPITEIDYAALAAADVVVVGTWTDGLFVVGQRPGRSIRMAKLLPVIDRKTAVVFCTYALHTGKTLPKLQGLVERKGGIVRGGFAIKRNKIEEGSETFVDRLLGNVLNV